METKKKLSLAARYRPQTFAEVAGQDMVRAVLSKACAEDKPACAYLFSGTRGVGKTTIARIFAKALNCEHAPNAEPCNQCQQCKRIMQGSHVDVIEIDGASNNKVEDVRALRETVGYAPMEGRYKIFIIDEAHMLTASAFNALLKTLEEPPPRVLFMMATTEAHKFPVTIVSRCQHFTFRHLNEDELVQHLKDVLGKEGLEYEPDAVTLIAKRAQGSVRDSMSLLDQTLALGGDKLTVDVTREVLGLAGQEFFEQLFSAMHARDCGQVITLTRGILRRGVDIGFLIREIAGYLRSLFLYAQSGSAILPILQLTPGEQQFVTSRSGQFSPAHLHAAWQLVLDAQRSVVQSTEPASALELLLLNMVLLPQLLPMEQVGQKIQAQAVAQPQAGAPMQRYESRAVPSQPPPMQARQPQPPMVPKAPMRERSDSATAPAEPRSGDSKPPEAMDEKSAKPEFASKDPETEFGRSLAEDSAEKNGTSQSYEGQDTDDDEEEFGALGGNFSASLLNWSEFCSFYIGWPGKDPNISGSELRSIPTMSLGTTVKIQPQTSFQYERVLQAQAKLSEGICLFTQNEKMQVVLVQPPKQLSSEEMVAEAMKNEEIRLCLDLFEGSVENYQRNNTL